jgi:hypothetical protein
MYTGKTAEWVIGVHPDKYLTDYCVAYAQGSGYDNSGGTHNFDTDTFIELWLYSRSGDELMSYAFPNSGNGTEFAWAYYGP